jgi:hypothetical protein
MATRWKQALISFLIFFGDLDHSNHALSQACTFQGKKKQEMDTFFRILISLLLTETSAFSYTSIAYYIHEQNKQNRRPRIHLSGIALGNGWIDARVQGPAVIDYAYWHGMIDSATHRAMHAEWDNCKDGSPQDPPFHDFTVPDECGIMAQVLLAGM